MPPDPPSRVCLCKLDVHVAPLLKILATGLMNIFLSAGIDRSLTLQATPFADKTVRLIVRSEERKAVGRKRFFRTARSHLASFNMLPPNVRCVRGGFAWTFAEKLVTPSKPSVKESGSVETGLT